MGTSTAALLLASALAKESAAALYILHLARVPAQDMDVPLPFDADPRWEKEARAKLAIIAHNTLKAEVQYVMDVRMGVPDIDIVRAAHELGVDLIVMPHGMDSSISFLAASLSMSFAKLRPVLVLHHA